MSEKIVITVNEGHIRGIKQISKFSRTEFYSFFGVPYGKPPIKNLRFKDPVKIQPWRNTLDATCEKVGCIQYSYLSCELMGNEDCLFNNIHIPKLPRKNEPLRPVIVNIHPGAYSFGSPGTKFYGSPDFIMHHDVIYVCIAYRLHILGFLNLKLKQCSGNQAIKDIVLSLRWIKDNIRSFGGDPENITILGSSSGSTLTNVLMLSPSTKGLFHKAVLMGAYLHMPSVPHQKSNEEHAVEVATALGYQGDPKDHQKLLSFLKQQEAVLLVEGCRRSQKKLQETIAPIFPISAFNITFDGGNILPELPRKLIESMEPRPIIIGFSEVESVMGFVRGVISCTEKNFKVAFRQSYFGWGHQISEDVVHLINKEVENYYLNGQPVEQAPLSIKMDIQTDILLSDVYDTVINPISAHLPSSVFVYKFEYQGSMQSLNTLSNMVTDEPNKGTYHASDFFYWNRLSDPKDKEAHQMVESFTKLVTTFARHGDPNYEDFPIKWRPCTSDNPCYLSINNPFVMVDGKLNNDRLRFWDSVKKKYKKEC